MERELDYQLLLPQPPIAVKNILGRLPDFCSYPLLLAQLARQYDFEHATLLRQQCIVDSFYIELVQLSSEEFFEMEYCMGQPRLFLFFMLDGQIDFSDGDGQCITQARAKTFHIAFNPTGHYRVSSHQDGYLALVVSVDIAWALESTKSYPHLYELLHLLIHSPLPYGYTPHCPIDHKVNLWLAQLYKLFYRNMALVEGTLRIKVLEAFDYYDDLLISTGILTLYKIKDRIDREFTNPNIDLSQLAEGANMHVNTMVRRFKKEFATTPYDYITNLRLLEAYTLIHDQGIAYSKVWVMVGYRSHNTFHKAYTKKIQ